MKQYLRANIKLGFKLSVLRRIRFHHTGLKLAKNPKLFHCFSNWKHPGVKKSFLIIWKQVIRYAIFFSSLNKDDFFLRRAGGFTDCTNQSNPWPVYAWWWGWFNAKLNFLVLRTSIHHPKPQRIGNVLCKWYSICL